VQFFWSSLAGQKIIPPAPLSTPLSTHYDYDKDGKYLGQLQLNPDGTFA
jgi:hypothetical protein